MTAIDGLLPGATSPVDGVGDASGTNDGRAFADTFRRAELDQAARQPRRRDRLESPMPGPGELELRDRDLIGRQGRESAGSDHPMTDRPVDRLTAGLDDRAIDADPSRPLSPPSAHAESLAPEFAAPAPEAARTDSPTTIDLPHLSAMPAAMATTLPSDAARAAAVDGARARHAATLTVATPPIALETSSSATVDASPAVSPAVGTAPLGSPLDPSTPPTPVDPTETHDGGPAPAAERGQDVVAPASAEPESSRSGHPDRERPIDRTTVGSASATTSSGSVTGSESVSDPDSGSAEPQTPRPVEPVRAASSTASPSTAGGSERAQELVDGVRAESTEGTPSNASVDRAVAGPTVSAPAAADAPRSGGADASPATGGLSSADSERAAEVSLRTDVTPTEARREGSAAEVAPRAAAGSAAGAISPSGPDDVASEALAGGSLDADVADAEVSVAGGPDASRSASPSPSSSPSSTAPGDAVGEVVDAGGTGTESQPTEVSDARQPARTAELASRIVDQLARREAFENAERTRGLRGERLELEVATERFGVVRVEASEGSDGLHLSLRSDGRADARSLMDLAAQLREQFDRDGVELAGLDVGAEPDTPGRQPTDSDRTDSTDRRPGTAGERADSTSATATPTDDPTSTAASSGLDVRL